MALVLLLTLLPAPDASATHAVNSPTNCEAGDTTNPWQGWTERTCTKGGEFTAYYRFMLGRDPDPGGFTGWMGRAGPNLSDAQNALVGTADSVEAAIRFGSNNGWWLNNLYWAAFDRFPDTSGYNFWLSLLNNGSQSRAQVAWNFALGLEFVQRHGSINGNATTERYVEADFYQDGLHPSRTFRMSYLHFASWKVFRQAADVHDALDWSDNGCSVPILNGVILGDSKACLRHDFGWRNFGNGLQIERTSQRKLELDLTLQTDLNLSCQLRYSWLDPRRPLCHAEAAIVSNAVQNWPW